MYPILGRYGPFLLHTYSVALGTGILLALGLTAVLNRRRPLSGWLDGALIAAGGALVLGRAVFVYVNLAYFEENPPEAWQLWLGGVNYHGALVGGLAAFGAWVWWTKRTFAEYAALLAPGLALVAAAGWAACWSAACAYGRPASPDWWAADLPDNYGVYDLRYPTQAVGLALSAFVLAITLWFARQERPPWLFWFTLLALSLTQLLVGFWRGDMVFIFQGVPAGRVIDAGLVVVAAICLLITLRKERRTARAIDSGK